MKAWAKQSIKLIWGYWIFKMKEKNKTLNYAIWFIIILIVAVGAWIFIGDINFGGNKITPYTTYNNYVIYEVNDGNVLRYKVEAIANGGMKYIHNFRNYPSDLLDLNYEDPQFIKEKLLYKDISTSMRKDKIYFSYNPNMDGSEILTAGTLVQILGNSNAGIFKIPVVIAFSEDSSNEDFPMKTCSDATKEVGIIELRYGEPKLYLEGGCIVIQGENREDFIKYNDLLSYILLEVIE